MLYGLPGFVQQAAYVALTDSQALMDSEAMRESYRRRRAEYRFANPGITERTPRP